jgi:hypothetical protein
MLIAPYTFAEWEDAMFAILRTPGFRDDLRLFVDPRASRVQLTTLWKVWWTFFSSTKHASAEPARRFW